MQNAFHQGMGAQAVKLAGAPAVDRGPCPGGGTP